MSPLREMVLMMAMREAEPRLQWSKMLKGKVGNNYRKPRDLPENRHSDSLKRVSLCTLSQGKMKKGDDVADDDDDDAERTNMSQGQVTASLCTEELFLRIQYLYIALSTYQTGKNPGGGRKWTVNMTRRSVPAGFHTSHNYFVTREDK